MRQLLKLCQSWLAVALLLLSLFLGWGLPMIIPNSPHNGILITIAGLILSAPFFIWAFVLYKRQQKQREVEQKPVPVPPPLDRSVKEKLPDGRTLTSYPPRVILGSPGSEDKMQKVMFKTEAGGEVHIPTSGSPRVLRFLRPHEVTIREEELPKEFPTGDGRIVVKKFTTTGFIIEEISTHNVQVEAEVYLKHNSN